MKNAVKLYGVIALVAVIGFSIAACKEDDGDNPTSTPSDPTGKTVTWKDSNNVDYKLAMTALVDTTKNVMYNISVGDYSENYESSLKAVNYAYSTTSYTYILNIGANYSVGSVTVNGNIYTFKPDPAIFIITAPFIITIDTTARKVSTAEYTISVVDSDGNNLTDFSVPVTDNAAATVTNTGGIGTNNFLGNWTRTTNTYVEVVVVNNNLTWTCTSNTGYNSSGTYSYINNQAIVYNSKGELIGYASVSGNTVIYRRGSNVVNWTYNRVTP